MRGLICSIIKIWLLGQRLAAAPVEWYLDPVKLAYIRWKDAVSEEASASASHPPNAALVELQEVGFLLGENEEAVVIGMEFNQDTDVQPGRWRLHIPRVSIQEMRVMELEKAFPIRRRRK
jgi:hypothetical protein